MNSSRHLTVKSTRKKSEDYRILSQAEAPQIAHHTNSTVNNGETSDSQLLVDVDNLFRT